MRWAFYLLIFGFIMICAGMQGVPEEKELKMVKGAPTEAMEWYAKKGKGELESVSFIIQKANLGIEKSDDHFNEVLALVKARKPMQVWFKADDTDDAKDIFKLVANKKTIISYAEIAESKKSGNSASMTFGITLLVIGVVAIAMRRGGNSSSAVRR